ncbi:MAG: tetratricopeptide repeat protein [Phycisphaerales bacterium]|nr:tetratricopeptide repeat protein [Phycisphaerales bacterium]
MSTAGGRIEQLRRLLDKEPNDAFCLYGLGQEYARRGDSTSAVQWYDRAIAADPDMSYAYFHKARVLQEADDIDGAVATLRAGLEAARRANDAKATNEIAGYLDELT